jgi:hypothetical protein
MQDMMLYGNTFEPWRILVLAAIGGILFLLTSVAMRRSLSRS